MPDLSIFGLEFENYCRRICLIAKFRERIKMPSLNFSEMKF